jgi:NAD(P)-dependent dehydrogenase (short-subunit alcohol dehydrogenase family)
MADPIQTLTARFPRKRIVVTGAASGLGLELCRRFAPFGWTIGMLDVDAGGLASAEQDVAARGATTRTAVVDVTDHVAFGQAVAAFVAATDGLDVMVNNAGVAVGGDFLDTRPEDWRWITGINLLGVAHGCQAALPVLRAAGRGILLNVASAASFASSPGMAPYNATKAAVLALSETLYGELLGSGIQVSVAMPYFFKTGLLRTLRASDDGRRDAELMMQNTPYTLDHAATDILAGVAAERFYVLAPPKLRPLWLVKRLFPMLFLRLFPRLRDRQLARFRGAAPVRSGA